MTAADTTEDRVATLHSLLNDAAKKVGEQRERIKALEAALSSLGKACAQYRRFHDQLGGDHIDTGRAWDVMRRAEDLALSVFAKPAVLSGEAK